jgi:hypothetical protein
MHHGPEWRTIGSVVRDLGERRLRDRQRAAFLRQLGVDHLVREPVVHRRSVWLRVGVALHVAVVIASIALMVLVLSACQQQPQMVDTSRYCMSGEPADQCAERQVR